MASRISKTLLVENWWESVKQAKNQLYFLDQEIVDAANEAGYCVPTSAVWKTTILSDLMWQCFKEWLEKEHPLFKDAINKNGFFTMFYRVSNAKKAIKRLRGVKITVVVFDKL